MGGILLIDDEEPNPDGETISQEKPEPKKQVKPQPEPEPQVEPQPEPQAEPQPEPEPEPQAEPQPEPELEPQAEPELEPQAEPEPEPQAEPQPEPELEPQAEPEPEPQAEPQPEPEPEPQVDPQPEPEPEPQVDPQPEPEPEPSPPGLGVDSTTEQDPSARDATVDLLKDLEGKLREEKKQQGLIEDLQPTTPPMYDYTGSGLVYNCSDQHWACVGSDGYKTCRMNYAWNNSQKTPTECYPFAKFDSEMDCFKIQQDKINSASKTDFCK